MAARMGPTFFGHQAGIFILAGNVFKAVAVAITDAFIGSNENQKVIEKIIELKPKLLQLFPGLPSNHFKKIATNPLEIAKSVIYHTEALRQVAIDEMVKQPPEYRSTFLKNDQFISPKLLRLSDTWIGNSAFKALGNAIGLPAKIQTGEIIYQASQYTPPYPLSKKIIVKTHNGSYFPKVSVDRYRLINSLTLPKIDFQTIHDPRDEEIIQSLKQALENSQHKHVRLVKTLNDLLNQGDTTFEQLKVAYIKTIERSDSTESNLPDFSPHFSSSLAIKEYEKQKIISDIALRLVAYPEKENIFFQYIEEPPKTDAKLGGSYLSPL